MDYGGSSPVECLHEGQEPILVGDRLVCPDCAASDGMIGGPAGPIRDLPPAERAARYAALTARMQDQWLADARARRALPPPLLSHHDQNVNVLYALAWNGSWCLLWFLALPVWAAFWPRFGELPHPGGLGFAMVNWGFEVGIVFVYALLKALVMPDHYRPPMLVPERWLTHWKRRGTARNVRAFLRDLIRLAVAAGAIMLLLNAAYDGHKHDPADSIEVLLETVFAWVVTIPLAIVVLVETSERWAAPKTSPDGGPGGSAR